AGWIELRPRGDNLVDVRKYAAVVAEIEIDDAVASQSRDREVRASTVASSRADQIDRAILGDQGARQCVRVGAALVNGDHVATGREDAERRIKQAIDGKGGACGKEQGKSEKGTTHGGGLRQGAVAPLR